MPRSRWCCSNRNRNRNRRNNHMQRPGVGDFVSVARQHHPPRAAGRLRRLRTGAQLCTVGSSGVRLDSVVRTSVPSSDAEAYRGAAITDSTNVRPRITMTHPLRVVDIEDTDGVPRIPLQCPLGSVASNLILCSRSHVPMTHYTTPVTILLQTFSKKLQRRSPTILCSW